MKKFVAILLVLLFILCACSSSAGKMVALIVGGDSDSQIGANAESEYALWSGKNRTPHSDSAVLKEMQIDFDGKTYSGVYDTSYVDMGLNYVKDAYNFDGGSFKVNRKSGKLAEMNLRSNEIVGNKTFEECTEIAQKLAEKYIDISEYEFTKEEVNINSVHIENMKDAIYNYRYYKTIAETETTDLLSIIIGASGEIIYFEDRTWSEEEEKQTELQSTAETIESYCSENALKKVEDKLKSLYPKYETCTLDNKTVVCLENGKLGVLYGMIVRFKTEQISETEYSSDGVYEYVLVANSDEIM